MAGIPAGGNGNGEVRRKRGMTYSMGNVRTYVFLLHCWICCVLLYFALLLSNCVSFCFALSSTFHIRGGIVNFTQASRTRAWVHAWFEAVRRQRTGNVHARRQRKSLDPDMQEEFFAFWVGWQIRFKSSSWGVSVPVDPTRPSAKWIVGLGWVAWDLTSETPRLGFHDRTNLKDFEDWKLRNSKSGFGISFLFVQKKDRRKSKTHRAPSHDRAPFLQVSWSPRMIFTVKPPFFASTTISCVVVVGMLHLQCSVTIPSPGWLDPHVSEQKTWWTLGKGSCMHFSVLRW